MFHYLLNQFKILLGSLGLGMGEGKALSDSLFNPTLFWGVDSGPLGPLWIFPFPGFPSSLLPKLDGQPGPVLYS